MTDEEVMEELLNSDGYSFPTWTLTLGLPTYEMRDVMSLIASVPTNPTALRASPRDSPRH